MKRLCCAAVVLVVAAVPACRAADDKTPETPYFPLKIGDTCTYREGENKVTEKVVKFEEVNKQICAHVEVRFSADNSTSHIFVAVKADGVYHYGGRGVKFEPPQLLLKLPPKKGDTWKYERTGRGKSITTYTSSEVEKLKVGGKEYEKVVVVSEETRSDNGIKLGTGTTYYAKGIGVIKMVFSLSEGPETVRELESFKRAADEGLPEAQEADDKMLETPYFPLKVGDTWTYGEDGSKVIRKVVKFEKVGKQVCARVEHRTGDSADYELVAVKADGVYRYALNGRKIEPPDLLLKLPFKNLETWKVESTVEGMGKITVDYRTVGELKTMTIRDKVYEKIILVYRNEYDAAGKATAGSLISYAKNVGAIDLIYNPPGKADTHAELVSFKRTADLKMPEMPETPYYPLKVGDTWTYRNGENKFTVKVAGFEYVDEQVCARTEILVDDKVVDSNFVAVKDDGVYTYFTDGVKIIAQQLLLKLPPKKGEAWKDEKTSPDVGKITLVYKGDEIGKLKVGGKEYEQVIIATRDDFRDDGTRLKTATSYFVKDIGMVKLITSAPGQPEKVTELESFKRGK
jgi:hypothetical protein